MTDKQNTIVCFYYITDIWRGEDNAVKSMDCIKSDVDGKLEITREQRVSVTPDFFPKTEGITELVAGDNFLEYADGTREFSIEASIHSIKTHRLNQKNTLLARIPPPLINHMKELNALWTTKNKKG